MTDIMKLREAARTTADLETAKLLSEAANTIEDLCKQIDGCIRVAADALRRAGDIK